MDRRESLPAEGESFSNNDMHNFSVSSIISNISKLLEGNNSSFLVHVDSNPSSSSPAFDNNGSGLLNEPKIEITSAPKEILPEIRSNINVSKTMEANQNCSKSFKISDMIDKVKPSNFGDSLSTSSSNQRKSEVYIKKPDNDIVRDHEEFLFKRPYELLNDCYNSEIDKTLIMNPKISKSSKSTSEICEEDKRQTQSKIDHINSQSLDIDESEFLLADIMKEMQKPLPIRRFPAPPLPSIFEQSCEDSLSRSRASSSSSNYSSKVIKKEKFGSANSMKLNKNLVSKIVEPNTVKDAKDTQFKLGVSKIPVSMPYKYNKNIIPNGEKTPFRDTDSIINSSSAANQTVLMVDPCESRSLDPDLLQKYKNDVTNFSNAEFINGPSVLFSELEAEHQRQYSPDSWNEFDRIMDKSLPPKELELHEFEELAARNNKSSELFNDANSFEYVDFQNAKLLLDHDEEERDQFCKSLNTSFSSNGRNSTEPKENDLMSMTNYFKRRSSFPCADRANESSMFYDDSRLLRDETLIRNVHNDSDITITPSTANINEKYPLLHTPGPFKVLDNKTKDLAKFLVGTESNGIVKTGLMEYVLDICNRRSSIGISSIPPELMSINPDPRKRKDSLFQVSHSPESPAKHTKADKKVKFTNVIPSTNLKYKTYSKKSTPKSLQEIETEHLRIQKKDEEEERSILLSEPGKAFHDDLDTTLNGFDNFKNHLHTIKKPKFVNLPASTESKENVKPSAFAPPVKPIFESNHRMSIERLRKAALSPPERPYDSRLKMQEGNNPTLNTPTVDNPGQHNANHSTPIAPDPISKLRKLDEHLIKKGLEKKTKVDQRVPASKQKAVIENKNIPKDSNPKVSHTSGSVNSLSNNNPQSNVSRSNQPTQDITLKSSRQVSSGNSNVTLQSVEVMRHSRESKQSTLGSRPVSNFAESLDNVSTKNVPEISETKGSSDHFETQTLTESSQNRPTKLQSQEKNAMHITATCPYYATMPEYYPQQMPFAIHIHLPSYPMGFPHIQIGPQNGHSHSTNMPTSDGITFQDPSSSSSACKCPHSDRFGNK